MVNFNFEKNLLEAVDNGLLSLGENPRKAIYYHLRRKFQLRREDIPKEAEQFDRALNSIFGPGAEIIEKYIVKNLYQRLKLNFKKKKDFVFVDYVKQAQLNSSRREKSELAKVGKVRLERRRQT